MLQKIENYPVHTTPNHHPLEMDVIPKTFVQIILASTYTLYSKWQMASTAFKYELCLSFCLILILQYDTRYEDTYKLLLSSQYVDFFG